MALQAGTRIGPYEVIGQIGAGGMGEVYRATDINLTRQVAIKVLPDTFANDPERLARFEREAKTLAALNHPNIAQIYGLEKTGGARALVMELVEGETLADRIAQGPLRVDEALPIARQIAEALEAAHEQGIIHRDLKPANIKVRPDGTVKVLDFGLAKALEPTGPTAVDATASPTITSPAMMTGVGMLLGTAAYMSPEQARGKPVDKRSDIWAFGCVLYEMLTGKRAFAGDEVSDVLASVLAREPDWTLLPARLSPVLATFIKRCLHKDRRQRIGDAQSLRLALDGAFDGTMVPSSEAAAVVRHFGWRHIATFSVIALLVGGILTGVAMWRAMRPTPSTVVRSEVTTSGSMALRVDPAARDLIITPDGSRIVYRGQNALFVRALDQLTPTELVSGVGAPRSPFVSPDGAWVGFFDTANSIRKVAITGGPAVTVAKVDANLARGATWGEDGTIVYATAGPETGLQRVSADGGEATVLTTPDRNRGEGDHIWPEFLPGGRAVLFTIVSAAGPGNLNSAQIAVLDLQTNTQTVLIRGGHHAHYMRTGHLVYGAGGAVRAVAFDPSRLEVQGNPVPVLDRVRTTPFGSIDAVVSGNGTLVYVEGDVTATGLATNRSLVWVDRQGREEPLPAPLRGYVHPRLSPDGARVMVFIEQEEADVWVWDLRQGNLTRLTLDPAADLVPAWTPDGRRVLFSSLRGGAARNLFVQPSDGTGTAIRLTDAPTHQDPTAVAPDGNRVLLNVLSPDGGRDIALLSLGAAPQGTSVPSSSQSVRTVESLITTRFEERGAIVSPDGRWLAYESNSSGQFEIYVRPFPAIGSGQWLVSTGGGTQALWARNGRELFYLANDGTLMSAPLEAGAETWRAGRPVKVLNGPYFMGGGVFTTRQYDVSLDGQRFLMIKDAASDEAMQNIVVVQNWLDELKRVAPTN